MQSNGHKILVIDVGGSSIKVLASGKKEMRKLPSGRTMTATAMAEAVKNLVRDWDYDRISLGYPGPVIHGRPLRDPHNLAPGWVHFDFERAFGCPVKILNDAAMQALGSYSKGRMLFLGLGTGLGSAMIVEGLVEPMELAHLPYRRGKTFEDYVGIRGLQRLGRKKWEVHVGKVVEQFRSALQAEEVVLGGGNAKKLRKLPPNTRLGKNANAFVGGFRMWEEELRARAGAAVRN
jgi:polyphosphate glucokinase